MIDIKWGPIIDSIEGVKQHFIRFSGNAFFYENRWNSERRYFLKWNRRTFAICLPVSISFWEDIRWIFGWRLHEKIDPKTKQIDPVILEIHFYKTEVACYR